MVLAPIRLTVFPGSFNLTFAAVLKLRSRSGRPPKVVGPPAILLRSASSQSRAQGLMTCTPL
jgi:hypothetical protein